MARTLGQLKCFTFTEVSMPKMKTFSFVRAGNALFFAVLFMLGSGAAMAQGYPVVVPASSSGASSRAIVQINQTDIYNNIANAYNTANYAVGVGSNAQNTANYAVNVGSAAQNTANFAVNVGSAAQGAADRALAEAANAGAVTKVATSNYQSGNDTQLWTFMCVKGMPAYDKNSGFPPFNDIFGCPGGSGPFVLSAVTLNDRP